MGEKLGQHFLKDKKLLSQIAGYLDVRKNDWVVEIGPGHGELTEEILKMGARVILIEKDRDLCDLLRKKVDKAEIFCGDVLDLLGKIVADGKLTDSGYKIIGNIPYYITGKIIRMISELDNKPTRTVLTIQKEVAQRICAKPPRSNLLSVITQFWSEAKMGGVISKKYFSPPPKVDSATIILETKKSYQESLTSGYFATVKKLFKQPRKTIINNLVGGGLSRERALKIVLGAGLKETSRPQELNVDQILTIASVL